MKKNLPTLKIPYRQSINLGKGKLQLYGQDNWQATPAYIVFYKEVNGEIEQQYYYVDISVNEISYKINLNLVKINPKTDREEFENFQWIRNKGETDEFSYVYPHAWINLQNDLWVVLTVRQRNKHLIEVLINSYWNKGGEPIDEDEYYDIDPDQGDLVMTIRSY